MPANDGETLPYRPQSYADDLYSTPEFSSNPMVIAAVANSHRRADRLRNDADILYRASRVAERHNCPAVHNACVTLAQALRKESDRSRKGCATVSVKRAVVNGREEPLV